MWTKIQLWHRKLKQYMIASRSRWRTSHKQTTRAWVSAQSPGTSVVSFNQCWMRRRKTIWCWKEGIRRIPGSDQLIPKPNNQIKGCSSLSKSDKLCFRLKMTSQIQLNSFQVSLRTTRSRRCLISGGSASSTHQRAKQAVVWIHRLETRCLTLLGLEVVQVPTELSNDRSTAWSSSLSLASLTTAL